MIVVDLQADFTTTAEGPLAVPGSDLDYLQAVKKAVRELKEAGLPVIATQDAHPPDHLSFAASHPGKKPLEAVVLPDGRPQMLWPVHCLEGSEGARILLGEEIVDHFIAKGRRRDFDSYSGFADDGGAATGLADLLARLDVRTLVVFGLATEVCVKATVIDGLAAGFKVVVVESLCRGLSKEGARAAVATMAEAGAIVWPWLDIKRLNQVV